MHNPFALSSTRITTPKLASGRSTADAIYLERLADRCHHTLAYLEDLPIPLPLRCSLYEGWAEIIGRLKEAQARLRSGSDDSSAANHQLLLRDVLPPTVELQAFRTMTVVQELCVQDHFERTFRSIWKNFIALD